MPSLDKQSCQLEVTRPVWLPYNDIADDIVAALVDQLGYPTAGPKAERYAVVLASLRRDLSQAFLDLTFRHHV